MKKEGALAYRTVRIYKPRRWGFESIMPIRPITFTMKRRDLILPEEQNIRGGSFNIRMDDLEIKDEINNYEWMFSPRKTRRKVGKWTGPSLNERITNMDLSIPEHGEKENSSPLTKDTSSTNAHSRSDQHRPHG